MTAEVFLVAILTGVIGWLSSFAVARNSFERARREEARAIAAALWAELAVTRDMSERLNRPAMYRELGRIWAETGKFPDAAYWQQQFDYEQADAYPYYAAAIPRLGALGHDLAAQITGYHATERVILLTLHEHFALQDRMEAEMSRTTAKIVMDLYTEFLARQEALLEELDTFNSTEVNLKDRMKRRIPFNVRRSSHAAG